MSANPRVRSSWIYLMPNISAENIYMSFLQRFQRFDRVLSPFQLRLLRIQLIISHAQCCFCAGHGIGS